MPNYNDSVISFEKPTLVLSGVRAYLFQLLLIGSAVGLPVAAHLLGAPVRYLLPMHWPVILAGLVYGWRGGALTGFLAPVVSYFFSGYPLPNILPSMTVELLVYGLVAGFLRERFSLNAFLSVTIALILGRIVFVLTVLMGFSGATNYAAYFQSALLPGIVAALCQILLLPFLSTWWIKQEKQSSNKNV